MQSAGQLEHGPAGRASDDPHPEPSIGGSSHGNVRHLELEASGLYGDGFS
jgi:hypothetical protein